MEKSIILILIDKRRKAATSVQEVLTKWGCNIKTRLGLHDGVPETCTESGFIMLEVVGDEKEKIAEELNNLEGVTAKFVALSI